MQRIFKDEGRHSPGISAKSALMLQGTGSDVGKSLLVAGLARALTRRNMRVRPFKPQNMSNNAAVTDDGGEIGRAQALQARACGLAPSVHMNPVLLKPQTDRGSQVVVRGRVLTSIGAKEYHSLKPRLLPVILESFQQLSQTADMVLVEGAGSPAEMNLRDGDIANMGFAEAADVPVVLVADISRGGVIASLVGTHRVLPEAERNRIKGYVINKFRGDKSLLDPALDLITGQTGWSCLGVVPWFVPARHLPAEDAMALEPPATAEETAGGAGEGANGTAPIKIAVPRLNRIANFDDLDPLRAEPDVTVTLVPLEQPLPGDVDLVLLPGSKSTITDLRALKAAGWDVDIMAHVRRGGAVLGICGGYQMLGRSVADPDGVEGAAGDREDGLGLLQVETVLAGDKTLRASNGTELVTGERVTGYEIHMGRTTGPDTAKPMLHVGDTQQPDGAVSEDGRIMGCYLHGLFTEDGFRTAFLSRFHAGRQEQTAYEAGVEKILNDLADHLEQHLDMEALLAIGGGLTGSR